MPRGITQDDVGKACDALLLEGARPTIERVRQKIGRGSPNTVSPMLDAWFKHLGGRIADPGAFSVPADIPDPVVQAARHFWHAALALTRADFDERLRESMAAAVANVEAEKERAALADTAAFEASAKVMRQQAELATAHEALEREKLLLAAADTRLAAEQARGEELAARLQQTEATLAEVRDAARQDISRAQERAAASERRTALEVDAERGARAKAEKRAELLERKLQASTEEARVAAVQHADAAAAMQAEVTRLSGELDRACATRDSTAAELAAISLQLVDAQREALAAKSQAELAERLLGSLKLRPSRDPAARRTAKRSATE